MLVGITARAGACGEGCREYDRFAEANARHEIEDLPNGDDREV